MKLFRFEDAVAFKHDILPYLKSYTWLELDHDPKQGFKVAIWRKQNDVKYDIYNQL